MTVMGKVVLRNFIKKNFKVGREETDSTKYGHMMEWEPRANKISKSPSTILGGYTFMTTFSDNF